MILIMTLQREIGRSCESDSRKFTLGIKQMRVSFASRGTQQVWKVCCIKFTTDSPIIGQNCWKKLGGKPFGLGALSDPIWNTTFLTSNSRTWRFNRFLSASSRFGRSHSSTSVIVHNSPMYNWIKKSQAITFRVVGSSHHSPDCFLSWVILLCLRQFTIEIWKYLVHRSPFESQFWRDFCFHNKSSW